MDILPIMSASDNLHRPASPLSSESIPHLPTLPSTSASISATEQKPVIKPPMESLHHASLHTPLGKSIEHMPPKKAHLLMLHQQEQNRHDSIDTSHQSASIVATKNETALQFQQDSPSLDCSVSEADKQSTIAASSVSAGTSASTSSSVSLLLNTAAAVTASLPAALAAQTSPVSGASARVTFATMRDMVQAALLLQPQCTASLPAIYSFVERFGRILTKGGVERHLTTQKNWKSSIRSTLYQNNIFMRAGAEGNWQIVTSRIDERPEISFGSVTVEQLRALAASGGYEQPASASSASGSGHGSPPPSPPSPPATHVAPSLPTAALTVSPLVLPSTSPPTPTESVPVPPIPPVKTEMVELSRGPRIKPAAGSVPPVPPERKFTLRTASTAGTKALNAPKSVPSSQNEVAKLSASSEPQLPGAVLGAKDFRAIKGLFERPTSILTTVPLHLLVTADSWALLTEAEREQLRLLLPEVDRDDVALRRLLRGHNSSFVQYANLFRTMLSTGTFDPVMAPHRAAAKRSQPRDPWKSEQYEDMWGEKLLQSLWAEYATNSTTASSASSAVRTASTSEPTAQPDLAGPVTTSTAPAAPLAAGTALAAVTHSVGETITHIEKAENEDELVDIGDDDSSSPKDPLVVPEASPPSLSAAAVVVAPPLHSMKKAAPATKYLQDLPEDEDENEVDEPEDELWKPAPRNHHGGHHGTDAHHQPRKGIAAHVLRRAGAPPSKAKKKTAPGMRSPFGKTLNGKRKLSSSSSGPISFSSPNNSAQIPRSLLPLKKQLAARAAVEALPAPQSQLAPAVTPKKSLVMPKPPPKKSLKVGLAGESPSPAPRKSPKKTPLYKTLATTTKKRPRSRSPSPNLPSPLVKPTFTLAQPERPSLSDAAPITASASNVNDSPLLGPVVYTSAAARALAREPTRRQLQALVAEEELRQLQTEAAAPSRATAKKRRPSNALIADAEGGFTATHPTPTKESKPAAPPSQPSASPAASSAPTPAQIPARQPAPLLRSSSAADDEVIDIMFSDEGKTETAWT